MAESIQLSYPEPDLAVLTFDMPDKGANILSQPVLAELAAALDKLEGREGLVGLIITSAKPGIFIAGADIREFAASLDIDDAEAEKMCRHGQQLFGRLSQTPFVTVAAIDGICVGGGAELAVWCDRRILTNNPKTQFGFPEVKLGLFPGWGGTARTPRMIGLSNALEIITGGESLAANAAHKLGLADDVVPPDDLLAAAKRLVRIEQASQQFVRDRERWSRPLTMSETELGFLGVTASAYIRQQTKGKYPAPEAALETMLQAAGATLEEACKIEAREMAKLFGTPINAALINVFFLTDRNKKDSGVDRDDLKPTRVSRVGVVGAGIMGAGIVAANLRRGVTVVLSDASDDALQRGAKDALQQAGYDREKKGADVEKVLDASSMLNLSWADDEFSKCDVVIEAVVENADVKRAIYKRLESKLRDDAILASNTSTIPITGLAQALENPDRFCGIHFFNPVRRMKLVEVIHGEQTSDETTAQAVAFAKQLGKMPIVVNDGPGFLVNRVLLPYMNEALELLCEGADFAAIERAAKSFGMPMGPLELYDMVGIDTAFYAGKTMWEAYPDRTVASPLLPAMIKNGRLGEKNGLGFYDHSGKRRKPDPELAKIVSQYTRETHTFTDEQLIDRLFLPMLLEATRILEENIVRDVRDVDLGLIFGLGFPAYKGGLLFWADQVGADNLIERLKPLERLGDRVRPTELLQQMAADNRTFYSQRD